jgi:hypothetical protein
VRDAGQALAPGDRFALQPRAPFRIAEDGDNVVVIAPGGELTFAAAERAAVERALGGEAFALADLASDKADAIVATMLAYGLVARI